MLDKIKKAIPNSVTIARIVLALMVLYYGYWLENEEVCACVAFLLGLATDYLDGWLAHILKVKTKIGPKLDQFADLFFICLSILTLFLSRRLDFGIVLFLITASGIIQLGIHRNIYGSFGKQVCELYNFTMYIQVVSWLSAMYIHLAFGFPIGYLLTIAVLIVAVLAPCKEKRLMDKWIEILGKISH